MTTKIKNPILTEISPIQQIQIDLLRLSSFNNFDGEAVADSLLKHRNLWVAFMIDREAYGAEHHRRRIYEELVESKGEKKPVLPVSPIDTIRLRDLAFGYWNVDALFILPQPRRGPNLYTLAETWGPDEVDWYDPLDAKYIWMNTPRVGEKIEQIEVPKMLRVWWD